MKGKLPWPSPRREAQVKLRGRIQVYSPAQRRRRSALIKASVNRSKQHISVKKGFLTRLQGVSGSVTWVQKWSPWAEKGSSFQSLSAWPEPHWPPGSCPPQRSTQACKECRFKSEFLTGLKWEAQGMHYFTKCLWVQCDKGKTLVATLW